MTRRLRTLEDLGDLAGKRVLVRCDFNVPLDDGGRITEDQIVSSDIVGSPASCTFDSSLTMTFGNQVKVIGWYDNEWGYASRLVDLTALVAARLR